ncbi:MAG: 50S ribosomal protein L31 [Chloroflexi bacterium RBG_13_56_8]|nr:MAG: 50S ribosomal protein L31 [Chloroflexi bacterium RBG_13_56_8]
MKEGIHPKYYPEARVICACGNTWTTGSTQEELRTDVCSNCHSFYTGQQRLANRGGQVERFALRVERARELQDEAEVRDTARAERERARILVEIVDEEESVEPIEDVLEAGSDEEPSED